MIGVPNRGSVVAASPNVGSAAALGSDSNKEEHNAAAVALIFSEFEKRSSRWHRELLFEREATIAAVRTTHNDLMYAAGLWHRKLSSAMGCWEEFCRALAEEVRETCATVSARGQERDRTTQRLLASITHDWSTQTELVKQDLLMGCVERISEQQRYDHEAAKQADTQAQLACGLTRLEDEKQRLAEGWSALTAAAQELVNRAAEAHAQHEKELAEIAMERGRLSALKQKLLGHSVAGLDAAPCAWSPPTVLCENVASLAPRLAVSIDSAGVSCGWILDVDAVRRLVVLASCSSTWTISLPIQSEPHVQPYTSAPFMAGCSGSAVALAAPVHGIVAPPSRCRSAGDCGGLAILSNVFLLHTASEGDNSSAATELVVTVMTPPMDSSGASPVPSLGLLSSSSPARVAAAAELFMPPPALVRIPVRLLSLPVIQESSFLPPPSHGDSDVCRGGIVVTLSGCPPSVYQQRWELRVVQPDASVVLLSTTNPAQSTTLLEDAAYPRQHQVSFTLRTEDIQPLERGTGRRSMEGELFLKLAGLGQVVHVGLVSVDEDALSCSTSCVVLPDVEETNEGVCKEARTLPGESTDDLPCASSEELSSGSLRAWVNTYHQTIILQDVVTGELREAPQSMKDGFPSVDGMARCFQEGRLLPLHTSRPIAVWLPDGADCVCLVGIVPQSSALGVTDDVSDGRDDRDGGLSCPSLFVSNLDIVVYAIDLDEVVATLPWPCCTDGTSGRTQPKEDVFMEPNIHFVSPSQAGASLPFVVLFSETMVVKLVLSAEWTTSLLFSVGGSVGNTRWIQDVLLSHDASEVMVSFRDGSAAEVPV